MFHINKSIFTDVLHINESTINNDRPAKEDTFSTEFDINDYLITIANEDLTINSECSVLKSLEIEHHEGSNTLPQ